MIQCLIAYQIPFSCRRLCHRLHKQRQGISEASAEGVCLAQGCSCPGEKGREDCILTDAHGAFELGKGSGEVALAEIEQTKLPRGIHDTGRMRSDLSNLKPFFPEDSALGEPT